MTDKEKAEEYIFHTYYVKDLTKEDKDFLREEVRIIHRRKIKAYLEGLAEGRKEEQEKTCYCKHIQNFEKENVELKEELRKKSDTNHSLVEQLADKEIIISELKKDKEWLDNTNNEQTEVILKLQAQIEKMKLENADLKNFLKNNLIQNTNNFLQGFSN